jgi:hypothetical protein
LKRDYLPFFEQKTFEFVSFFRFFSESLLIFAVEKENKEYKPIKKKNYEKDDVFVREFVRDEFSSIC